MNSNQRRSYSPLNRKGEPFGPIYMQLTSPARFIVVSFVRSIGLSYSVRRFGYYYPCRTRIRTSMRSSS